MNYNLDFDKQVLVFEGKKYASSELQIFKQDLLARENISEIHHDLLAFLQEWFDTKDYIEVRTSGSTGAPKIYHAKKKFMVQSAIRTCSALGLCAGDSVLLCMPLQFIGSKMIVVRALVAGLDLYCVQPSLHPMQDISFSPDFVSMTVQQAAVSLKDSKQRQALMKSRHLMLGGMAVMPELEKEFQDFPNTVWLTFGMTETLSHIALRKLNTKEKSPYFTPFSDVKLSLTQDECLIIDAPFVCEEVLVTKDRAELLEDNRFRILGRVDNVVNSGGIKIQIEEVEEKLAPYLNQVFQISAVRHEELGEQLVLLTEEACEDWKEKCKVLSKYERPRLHILLSKLPLTDSGKPDRHNAKILAQEYISK